MLACFSRAACGMFGNPERAPLLPDGGPSSSTATPAATENTGNRLINGIFSQFSFGLITSFIRFDYSVGMFITKAMRDSEFVLGTSLKGLYFATPLAMMFAIAEAYSHLAQSDHFESGQQNQSGLSFGRLFSSLSRKQKAIAVLHYVHDIIEGSADLLAVAEAAGLGHTDWYLQLIGYTSILALSAEGTRREFINTVIAFGSENERQQVRAMASV